MLVLVALYNKSFFILANNNININTIKNIVAKININILNKVFYKV